MSIAPPRAPDTFAVQRPQVCANRSTQPSAELPDDVLIRIVRRAQPPPLDLLAWQSTSRAFLRVCTDNAVWAGRAHRPADRQGSDAIWQDICVLPQEAKAALALIWRNARARSVPEASRGQLGHRQVAYAAHLNAPWLLPLVGSPLWDERHFVADLVRHGHLSMRQMPPAFAENTDMLRAAFAHDPLCYGLLPPSIQSDPRIAWAAVAHHGINLKDVPLELRTQAMGRRALATYANAIHHTPEPMRSNRALWLELLPRAPELLYKASPAIRSDPEILRFAIHRGLDAVRRIHWTAALRADAHFAAFLVAHDAGSIKHFDAGVRRDRTVALTCLHELSSVEAVHPDLYDDEVYALAMVQRDGDLLKIVSPRLRQDDTILQTAITTTPRAILRLKLPLRGRRDLAQLAIAQDGSLLDLSFFRNLYSHDRDLVLSALKTCPAVFRHAAAALRADRDVCLLALRGDSSNHRYLIGNLALCDPEVSLAAGGAPLSGFQYASAAVRDDRTEVLTAVSTNGALLEFASSRLQGDGEVVRTTTENCPDAIRWATPHLRQAWRKRRKKGDDFACNIAD